jgi:hypothetical protein
MKKQRKKRRGQANFSLESLLGQQWGQVFYFPGQASK